ncbi:hypothetical protein BACT_0923 [Bifidobacterium actinocoloniiforme DSM 22766]|uniref:Uncharacterized protein n=1 Tax=Bifidobacterium actinocoloniiforme DSM 22766 TaxID=1437605 RepID=A0A086Z121_9BIFI|nr:hypothetical protein [Bifidobacterium actinocoloniiforme]AKV55397.1 hypothetical protein AB656_03225 [Bifidobacterium actinocoloniiforme DSM 22766]KFI40221.1 hypothetical protein BACT_0923 [Bifidobacterium actinocoloniiforme DSM 22766]
MSAEATPMEPSAQGVAAASPAGVDEAREALFRRYPQLRAVVDSPPEQQVDAYRTVLGELQNRLRDLHE